MAKVKLVQENNDIAKMIKALMIDSDTGLTEVCEKHGLNYQKTNASYNKKTIDLDDLETLIKQINPKAKMSVDINISLSWNGKEIFTQKTEK
jgi:Asp-tRNA(Asn)/Glu-tRNA(Gln) amidotransferase B subunit